MADSKLELGIPVIRDADDKLACTLVNPFQVGDCQMNAGARVEITAPDAAGASVVSWEADVLTGRSQLAFDERWHQAFNFKTNGGTPVLSVGPERFGNNGSAAHISRFASPRLDAANRVKHVSVRVPVLLDPNLFDLITQVDWEAEC
jgi:hypothetical protein